MMKVDTLPDELGKTARYFSIRVAGGVRRQGVLVFLREFEGGVLGKNGQFTRKCVFRGNVIAIPKLSRSAFRN
jgi:hypothetical protein